MTVDKMMSGASSMTALFDALWRALAYCLHPRVIWLSVLPLVLSMVCLGGLAWWGWESAVAQMRVGLDTWSLSQTFLGWLDGLGASGFRAFLAPLLVVIMAVPVVVVVTLLVVAMLMGPSIVKLVASRRFPGLVSRHSASFAASAAWSLSATLLALVGLFVTLPLWFIPPFALVLPPLIWGWLTYRVLTYDALGSHATPEERQRLMARHRTPLLAMGIITGYLGAAPSALWALSAITVALAPLVLVASVWIYTLVFAFSCLWFTHYLLAALQAQRLEEGQGPGGPPPNAGEAPATPSDLSPSGLRPAGRVPSDALIIDVPSREVRP